MTHIHDVDDTSHNPSQTLPATATSQSTNPVLDFLNQLGHTRSIPPLEDWHPAVCGTMDLVIKANGEWWHEGRMIKRQSLIDLFARVLWREEDTYYLKTPIEKIEIQVEDVPLLVNQVTQVEINGQTYLHLTTTNQDEIIVDAQHPLMMRAFTHKDGTLEYRPYVRVRHQLDALIERQAFYHLVNYGELVEQDGLAQLQVSSGEHNFILAMPLN